MDFQNKIPGKIFLIGEYAAVLGAPAVVAALDLGEVVPRGFGSSSVEWFKKYPELEAYPLWKKFKSTQPYASGYDLLAQKLALEGKGAVFQIDQGMATPVLMHEHLQKLSFVFSATHLPNRKVWTQLDVRKKLDESKVNPNEWKSSSSIKTQTWPSSTPWSESLVKFLETGDFKFAYLLNDWAVYLKNLGLEDPPATQDRLNFLSHQSVLSVKGCGAGLSDVFWVLFKPELLEKNIELVIAQLEEQTGLKCLGNFKNLLWKTKREVKVFAPVNIALIKYMGKLHQKPTNASFSLTLKQMGTQVRLSEEPALSEPLNGHQFSGVTPSLQQIEFQWSAGSYIPPQEGQNKLFNFLKREDLWLPFFSRHSFPVTIPKMVNLWTQNNVPTASGIATSASSFAAYTVAWFELLTQKKVTQDLLPELSWIASQGSGSAGRSLMGPWVEWNEEGFLRYQYLENTLGDAKNWYDIVLLFEDQPKEVSSSEAHVRVITSPHFKGRKERAQARLKKLKELLAMPEDFSKQLELSELVFREAVDMHELFETSQPPFSYRNQGCVDLFQKLPDYASQESLRIFPTMDAGANVHLLVHRDDFEKLLLWVKKEFPQTPVIWSEAGNGVLDS